MKISKKYVPVILLLFCFSLTHAQRVVWNLNKRHGVTQEGFAKVIEKARTFFDKFPEATLVIRIEAGTYKIGGDPTKLAIDLTKGFTPGTTGRLIFRGAGMNKTKLVFTNPGRFYLKGEKIYRIEFRDIHFARPFRTATQGTVVRVNKGSIDVRLHKGFPSPIKIFHTGGAGRYLRRYTNSKTDPQIILDNNEQIPFGKPNRELKKPERLYGRVYRIFLNNENLVLKHYKKGEYVGIKSRNSGNAFWFLRGKNLTFRNVKWTGSTRGLVRGGFDNLKIINCRLERGEPINGQVPCLASSTGGIQVNQPGDGESTGTIINRFYCDSPGDDCLAFFNVNGAKVYNSVFKNSFARGVLLTKEAKDVCFANSELINNPIKTGNPEFRSFSLEEAIEAGVISNCGVKLSNRDHSQSQISPSTMLRFFEEDGFIVFESNQTQEPNFNLAIYDMTGKLVDKKNAVHRKIKIEKSLL